MDNTAHDIESLIAQIKDEDNGERWYVAIDLANINDPRLFDRLLTALHDDCHLVIGAAARALGKIGDKRAFEPLVKLLEYRSEIEYEQYEIRSGAIYGLSMLGDKRAIDFLLPLLKGEDMVFVAACALCNFGDERVIVPIVNTPRGVGHNKAITQALVETFGDAILAPLVETLDNPNLCGMAAYDLSRLRNQAAVEPLIRILTTKSHSDEVYRELFSAIGNLGGQEAFDFLLKTAADTAQTDLMRGEALECLGMFGLEVVPQLLAGLNDAAMRFYAGRGLTLVGDQVVPYILPALQSPDASIRATSVSVLAERPYSLVAHLLITALADKDKIVRANATSALFQVLFRDQFKANLMPKDDGLQYLLEHQSVVEPLISALEDEIAYVRQGAALALGSLGFKDESVIAALKIALNDIDEHVVSKAYQSLGMLRVEGFYEE